MLGTILYVNAYNIEKSEWTKIKNVADIFTKALPRDLSFKCRGMLVVPKSLVKLE